MGKILDQAVTANGDVYDFQCPGVQGSACGEPGGATFRSTGWPTKKAAAARGEQHFADHRGDRPMQELAEFRKEQGLVVADDGSVSVEDI